MGLGILAGHLLKKKKRIFPFIGKLNTGIIFLLLFVMGISVGNNREIMENITGLGSTAILIGIGCTTGSIIFTMIVQKIFFKEKIKKEDKK
ncbi:LysO family transporter [Coprobacter tertius]|uniref:Lysine exporter LysO family protein n=1 Tax=Coprobacter tertius TaxID=2944915 RepID=A0ABT1MLV6_9BACT|nr:LysO family transporter [Coprobacter tertius]MCP9612881.1 lysine exporter LysO family protein [Coprobacter tertius]